MFVCRSVGSCSKTNCGVGSMNYAFEQTLFRDGVGFPNCTEPSVVPVTIVLQTEIDESDNTEGLFESYTVEVLCEENTKAALREDLDPSKGGKRKETLYVEDKEGSCKLSLLGVQVWTAMNISYQILDGLDSSTSSMMVLTEGKNVTSDILGVPVPALYSRCLKQTLAEFIDPEHFYTGSYQDEVFAWLNNEIPKESDCENQEYLIERYALAALCTAEEIPENKTWISPIDHCTWPRVRCNGNRVSELTYGKSAAKLFRKICFSARFLTSSINM